MVAYRPLRVRLDIAFVSIGNGADTPDVSMARSPASRMVAFSQFRRDVGGKDGSGVTSVRGHSVACVLTAFAPCQCKALVEAARGCHEDAAFLGVAEFIPVFHAFEVNGELAVGLCVDGDVQRRRCCR